MFPDSTYGGTSRKFFLGDKVNEAEFSDEDVDALLLFAAQAGAAIVNARVYRAEQRARADLEAVVETSPVGVIVIDPKTGRPILINREARNLFEILRTPGEPLDQLFDVARCRLGDGSEIPLNGKKLIDRLSSTETMSAEEVEVLTPDGRNVTVLVNSKPILSDDDTVESRVVTLQDLAPILALEKMQADFLGMVSHELRTPLSAVKGSTITVLESGQTFAPTETQQFFRIINEQADRMSALITDLLDAGRIDAGTLSVATVPSDVGELFEQARTLFLSSEFRHTIVIDLPEGLPKVMADQERIVQVLSNLLVNAARASPATSPITLSAENDQTHVAISVTDVGRGIPPEHKTRLFTKYSDGKVSGLGLAICKGLVEAHGGRIRAESAGLGQGSCFTFTIPIVGGSQTDVATSEQKSSQESASRPRILVVDDDPQMLRFVRGALIEAGYAPIVETGHEKLSHILATEKPELVVLDLVLPGTDGIELMETVPGLIDRPVIFISGYGRDETIARALDSGAEDYIVKPFSPTELTARIAAALRRRAGPEVFSHGELSIDYARRIVTVGSREVELTATEFELLRVLSQESASGRVVTFNELQRRIWSGRKNPNRKLVRAYVKRLRRQLGETSENPTYIVTERGVGYRMKRSDEA